MPLAALTSQLTDAIAHHGVLVVVVLMAIDAVLPVGGELVMLYAGALASGALAQHPTAFGASLHHGPEAYVALAAAGALGSLVGALGGWLIGVRGGRPLVERHGRWLHLGPDRLDRAERWFDRFGDRAVLLGRLTPLVRSFISIPAGVLGSPLGRYTALTLAGSLIWCFGFAGAGWALGSSYDGAHHALRDLDVLIAVAAAALIAVGLTRLRRTPARS
jgi:membrane protein DedA with SNARE-associated domain